MTQQFWNLTFTPAVVETQLQFGHRSGVSTAQASPLEDTSQHDDSLSAAEVQFIAARDSFYMATVNEDGWPYMQHRGGPTGFLKVLDTKTLAFADFRGNRQMLSMGNIQANTRTSLFFMDYANKRRLKVLAHAEFVDAREPVGTVAELLHSVSDPDYPAVIERIVLLHVVAFDWNCPQHITPRLTETEWLAANTH